jgi:site-specific DNA recombinase
MPIALYVRVSTQRQAQAQTIDQQLDRLHTHLQAQGWAVRAEHIFRDDGYSGAHLQRPGLARLREAVHLGQVDHVVLTAPDRLARNYAHQVLLLEELGRTGCQVTFLDRPMSADPHDQLVLQIRGAVAEYERSLIAERMRRGRQQKLRAGHLLPWTQPPFGYAVDPERPRDPAGVRLAEPAATLVAEMFAYYIEEGHSLVGLAKHLMARQVPTPKGHWRWNAASLRDILTNPVYTGTLYTGRTRARPTQQRHSPLAPVGQRPSHNGTSDPSEWVAIGQVPPIVSAEQFAAVRAKMAQNQQFAVRHNTAHRYLLRALVSCGRCRGACFGRTAPGDHSYYVCRGKQHPVQSHQDMRCNAPYVRVGRRGLGGLVWLTDPASGPRRRPPTRASGRLVAARTAGPAREPAQRSESGDPATGALDGGVLSGYHAVKRIPASAGGVGNAPDEPGQPSRAIGGAGGSPARVGRASDGDGRVLRTSPPGLGDGEL